MQTYKDTATPANIWTVWTKYVSWRGRGVRALAEHTRGHQHGDPLGRSLAVGRQGLRRPGLCNQHKSRSSTISSPTVVGVHDTVRSVVHRDECLSRRRVLLRGVWCGLLGRVQRKVDLTRSRVYGV